MSCGRNANRACGPTPTPTRLGRVQTLDPAEARQGVADARRVVVKIGSSSLTGPDGGLCIKALTALVNVLASHCTNGRQVVLVTSGAVAAGITPLGLTTRPRDLATMQAAAAVGQGLLIAHYTEAFAKHGLGVGQILLTADDLERRDRYANAQRSLNRLLELGLVPIINENDAVTTEELKFGDNDRLAALTANLAGADALVLLTDVDGLHDRSPSLPGAQRISFVSDLTEIADVPVSVRGSSVGTGGMVTKLESVRIATGSGVPVIVTAAASVAGALRGEDVGTCFAATSERSPARRLWIAHAAQVRGQLFLDDGAATAVRSGEASLLPAGVCRFSGKFSAGDAVELLTLDATLIARGLVGYDSAQLARLIGRQTAWLRENLGDEFGNPVVHRDSLILL